VQQILPKNKSNCHKTHGKLISRSANNCDLRPLTSDLPYDLTIFLPSLPFFPLFIFLFLFFLIPLCFSAIGPEGGKALSSHHIWMFILSVHISVRPSVRPYAHTSVPPLPSPPLFPFLGIFPERGDALSSHHIWTFIPYIRPYVRPYPPFEVWLIWPQPSQSDLNPADLASAQPI
jgi:hypothetical protein